MDELCGPVKTKVIASARQIAMYLCRELTDLSLPKIGQTFGGRDHTTVMHADKKIRQLMAERRATYDQVTELTNRIKQRALTTVAQRRGATARHTRGTPSTLRQVAVHVDHWPACRVTDACTRLWTTLWTRSVTRSHAPLELTTPLWTTVDDACRWTDRRRGGHL